MGRGRVRGLRPGARLRPYRLTAMADTTPVPSPRRPVDRGCLVDAAIWALCVAVIILAVPAIRFAWLWLWQAGDRIAG